MRSLIYHAVYHIDLPLPLMTTLSGHASPAAVIAVTMVWTTVAVIAVVLRLYCRLVIAENPGWDDAFVGVAAILAIGLQLGTCFQSTSLYV